jgi:hypothetical protein
VVLSRVDGGVVEDGGNLFQSFNKVEKSMTSVSFKMPRLHTFAAPFAMWAAGMMLSASSGVAYGAGACDKTTAEANKACTLSAESDYRLALGTCANASTSSAQDKCISRAQDDLSAAQKLCTSQQTARQNVCSALGQAPYDPAINPTDFVARINNPLMPMRPGDVRVYTNGHSTVTVTVTDQTIKLLGVLCTVVHDVNRVDGEIEEDTLDYFAQDRDGTVWYFGEDTIAYDNGVASTEGSWRAGVERAKPGVVMFDRPKAGTTNRQEFLLGTAEDMAKAVAFNQHVHVPIGSFDNAFETFEFTPIEPKEAENKFYVPGIGQVLTDDLQTGEREELVGFSHK